MNTITIIKRSVKIEAIYYNETKIVNSEQLVKYIKDNWFDVSEGRRVYKHISSNVISNINKLYDTKMDIEETFIDFLFCGTLG